MKLLDKINIDSQGHLKTIELLQGDVTDLAANEHFNLLVVSAFPNDYIPTPTSIIGALYRRGFLMSYAAMMKEMDMRTEYACWLSKEIDSKKYRGLEFDRILCFEPLLKDLSTPEMIADLFKALMTISTGHEIKSVGIPLIATGDANYPVNIILNNLVEASVNWMTLGLPTNIIKIIAYENSKAQQALTVFSKLKEKYKNYTREFSSKFTHDYFISYSHQNTEYAELLLNLIRIIKPNCKIFIDKKELRLGYSWQEEIFTTLDSCRKIITLLSDDYINSKVCKEEYHIAHFRQRESNEQVLLPLYLYSCQLPTFIKLTEYFDCREGQKEKIKEAASYLCNSQEEKGR